MANKQRFIIHQSGALGAGGTTTIILSGATGYKYRVYERIAWVNNTTAMTSAVIKFHSVDLGGGEFPIAADYSPQVGKLSWFVGPVTCKGTSYFGDPGDEWLVLQLNGTVNGDNIEYTVLGYDIGYDAYERN
jgi:hypothetical protein